MKNYLTKIDNLFEKYSYPSELKNIVKEMCNILFSIKGVKSIILSGSLGRGEFTYFYYDNEIRFLSDIEMFVIVEKKNREINSVQNKINNIESYVSQTSKLFHIDISFLEKNKINKLPPWLQFWEIAKENVILGDEIKITPKPIDLRYLNEFSLNRLQSIILYFPKELFFKIYREDKIIEFNYILHRALLDIPTWLLPYEGYLIHGLLNRCEFVINNHQKLKFVSFMPKFFLDLLYKSMQVKKKPGLHIGNIGDKLGMVLECYIRAIEYILFKFNLKNKKDIISDILSYSHILFDEFVLKRKIFELFLLLSNFRNINNLKWIFLRKKGLIVSFLLSMNFSLFFNFKNSKEKLEYLIKAENFMRELDFRTTKFDDSNFIDKWLKLRKEYIEFLCFFNKFYKTKRKYYLKVIK